ncbi:hypothetical protein [Nocardioides montaniterrae]
MRPRLLPLAAVLLLTSCSAGHRPTGTADTDRQAHVLGLAIAYPRQQDAAGLARAALAANDTVAVLEATDVAPSQSRLVIRIHVPTQPPANEFERSTPAYDACYRLTYQMPSSSLDGEPDRVDCPAGAIPMTPPPAPPVPHLPRDADARMRMVLRDLPPAPSLARVRHALRVAFPSVATVDAAIEGDRVAAAVGVSSFGHAECEIGLRTGTHVGAGPMTGPQLEPGEAGCEADLALHPVVTH